jgi:hypothetical protein
MVRQIVRQRRLACSSFVTLTYGEAKGGINSQEVGVVAVLLPSCYLIHSLPDHLKLGEAAVNPAPGILQFTLDRTQDPETLVYLSQQEEIRVRGNLSLLKICHDCRIEFRSNCLFCSSPHPDISFPSTAVYFPHHIMGLTGRIYIFFVIPPNNPR